MPLILRRTREVYPDSSWSEDHYTVLSGAFVVGVIRRMYSGPQGERWSSTINGVNAEIDVMEKHGMAATLDDARAEFVTNWRKWLAWAALKEEAQIDKTAN